MILETIDAGTAIVGIFHDAEVRDAVATERWKCSPLVGQLHDDRDYFTNAKIVTSDRVLEGSVKINEGEITDISDDVSGLPAANDFDGDYLMPGFVELHTDNLEKHFRASAGVDWPHVPPYWRTTRSLRPLVLLPFWTRFPLAI